MNHNYRIVHKFRYGGKVFRAGELTVGLYMVYSVDPHYAVECLLTEFNKTKPKLSQVMQTRFLRIMFGQKKPTIRDIVTGITKPGRKDKRLEKSKQHLEDFHIWVSFASKHTNLDIMNLPIRIFRKLLADMGIITGKDKYDANRNSRTVDRKALGEAFGHSKAL